MNETKAKELARQIVVQIMRERARAGSERVWTLEEWEAYIVRLLAPPPHSPE